MSGRLLPTVAFSFLVLHCFKIYLPSFSRYKTTLFNQYYVPEHAEQEQTDAKRLEKKLISRHKCQRVGKSLIIVNKSIKETENFIFFFSVGSNFISLMNTKTCIFTRGYGHS